MTFDSKCAYCIDQLLGQHVKNSGFRIYSEFGGAENTDSPADWANIIWRVQSIVKAFKQQNSLRLRKLFFIIQFIILPTFYFSLQ